jgi:HPt (histidine-containing phosphotransfer) domain-containing protein
VPVIDWDAVAELRAEIGEEDFAEVVDAFLEETDEVIARLRTTPDPAGFRSDFHFLKGSALNLGLKTFAEVCRTAEEMAAAGKGPEIDLVEAFRTYESSKSEFLSTIR